jgi:hypothetical protein
MVVTVKVSRLPFGVLNLIMGLVLMAIGINVVIASGGLV